MEPIGCEAIGCDESNWLKRIRLAEVAMHEVDFAMCKVDDPIGCDAMRKVDIAMRKVDASICVAQWHRSILQWGRSIH